MSGAFSVLDYIGAGGAAVVAGAINGIAGGGTLVSFPALIAIGVPALPANVTNTVALSPGYLSGSLAARVDLRTQRARIRRLAPFSVIGGLAGALLLEVTPESTFRAAVPWLVLAACALLLAQDRVRGWVLARSMSAIDSGDDAAAGDPPGPTGNAVDTETATASPALCAAVLVASVYGGFFGAGLGIMLLAVLGVFCGDSLVRLNAVKQVVSFLINIVAAVCFAITGHVRWQLVPIMAVAALLGGVVGSRLAQRVNPTLLRRVVVVFGVAVAINFFVS
ncbi:sulfite exporter TauE/SafE family protein [Acidiferrimicrobium sp. IK]|uniref:sulfite exporter TauE/SafE family protein n=1 Tax=Acidiferrimicrobium sp. IK TaxID=2871700 RepID=UPI0021CB7CCE|nr:sulfite exporter TauE/SafE family protein [Acidiferrimicrobium sp. IK]MCU4187327.1 sulfite exporter TauE/SafE family protein [Acidiferrimicrobium sp. IK]